VKSFVNKSLNSTLTLSKHMHHFWIYTKIFWGLLCRISWKNHYNYWFRNGICGSKVGSPYYLNGLYENNL